MTYYKFDIANLLNKINIVDSKWLWKILIVRLIRWIQESQIAKWEWKWVKIEVVN